ncbi:hybrid sensor histidine kinase/response regulator [Paraburkholderia unamae]|uniref:histidine kinase n=1 Tax=Paraburkholderia unamae TaxID=219649 RepID=A0ABX5KYU2_9BURK|nr:hybrid sensor histidine kinase/response regulator [Paraburkholderia unamae]PVX86697.1 two-component system capsular synthesis sensor histidine kinase RcsC [Paraburkholderia unamae]CAG9274221.1 Signal transduction histidine kinase [Paraburkholderia unamae]
MPRSAYRNGFAHTSPYEALGALERNLKRERRVFAMLTGLLIFAALCMAAIAIASVTFASLRTQALRARTTSAQVDALIERQHTLVIGTQVVLSLESASPRAGPPDDNAPAPCAPTFAGLNGAPELRAACNRTVRLASAVSPDAPLLLLAADGSAAYGYRLGPAAHEPTQSLEDAAAHARLLADAVLLRMTARATDPVRAARELKVIWFRPPAALGFPDSLVLGALSVLKDGKPYAFVLTSVDLAAFDRIARDNDSRVMPTLFDAEGAMLAGPLSAPAAQLLDRRIANLPTGSFHALARFGWVLREQPLAYGFGRYIVTLSWGQQFALIRLPLLIILALTAALVAMLITLSHYWNRRVLTRTYDEASRALEGELLNHLLVHATPVGLCIVRRSNFEIVVANQIVRNVLGLDANATRLPNTLCAEFEKHLPWPTPAHSDDETPVYELPYSLERPGEEGLHLAITYAPATMNREDVMFCAVADMSKHYEVERLLREAKRMSDEAARAKVSFFAAMSHEIRTPLASLVGNIELVARGPLAPEQGARVQAMQISAAELLQIVSDVLDFSKIDVGQMKLTEAPGSIAGLLGRIALAHAPLAVRQRLPFFLVMDRAIPAQLHFDAVRLAQIVNNLLSNAFKFTRSGKIVLRASWREGALEIGVSDSGGGISDDLKQHLFKPFTQGDGQRLTQARGTGLGLSICARLAQLMHGRIALDSTLGVGTRVTVTLPLRAEGETTAGEEWTLHDAHPAILCRAPENREWLANLFDARASAPTFLSLDEPPREGTFDYLLVTDEFARDDVAPLWGESAKIVWLRQDGPLVPLELGGGAVEVSLYSLAGIRAATQMIVRGGGASTAGTPQPETGVQLEGGQFASLNVLIAEDNLLNRGLLRDQLRTLGANVIETKDGEEALARLGEREVDLVLTDLNMPGMNGNALLEATRAKFPDLPVYALSSNALPEQIAQGRALGFTDYLTKPLALAELARVLSDVSARTPASQDTAAVQDSETDSAQELPRFPALTAPLAGLFIEQAERDIADYAQIAQQRDFKRLRDWAHRVSGGLAVLGPSMLNEACLELRATMREAGQWTDDVGDLAAAVADELDAMRVQAASRDAA